MKLSDFRLGRQTFVPIRYDRSKPMNVEFGVAVQPYERPFVGSAALRSLASFDWPVRQ